MRLRTGDTAVLTEYDQHGRIHGGDADQIMDEARKTYLAAYLTGRDAILMAQSHETCRELSQRIRDDLVHLGLVSDGPSAALRDGARASVGDLIITRKNDHGLGVANGDTWRVEAVDGDRIVMRRMVDPDRETGARRYADSTVTYNAGKTSADLAYADDGSAEPGPASRPRLHGHWSQCGGPDRRRWDRADHRHRDQGMGVCCAVPGPGQQPRLRHHRTHPGR